MSRQRDITEFEFIGMKYKYWGLKDQLPPRLQQMLPPNLEQFLSPANYTRSWNHQWVGLSITGTERYEMLLSPHALTLLKIYCIKRLRTSVEVIE